MMRNLWRRFEGLSGWIKVIFVLCLLGTVWDTYAVGKDLLQGGILLRLHMGFLILYAGQVVFILWGERTVFILSLLQAVIALMTNLDFTFVPVLRVLGAIFYTVHGTMSLEQIDIYKYVFVSACFTLELLKTYLLWALLPGNKAVSLSE